MLSLSPTLAHVPGMRRAAAVPELRAEDLGQCVFLADYVGKSRPCVIKGAVRHWPASQKWRDKHYLKSRAGHHNVYFYPHENYVSLHRQLVDETIISLAEAVDRATDPNTKIAYFGTTLAVELLPDTAEFSFVGERQAAFFYPHIRYFLYRNAGTTWHYHPFDETLMCQVLGTKKVGLLSLDNPHHLALRNIFFQEDYYEDPARFAGFENAGLNWFEATVEEGDALYIPPLWWHGVVPVTQSFGITAAVPWRSPLPVIADSIRKMAAGRADIVGKASAQHVPELIETARRLGLEKELAIAWQRGN